LAKPKFYDFCVHTTPDGENTVSEMASLARYFGYSGIAIANHSDKFSQAKPGALEWSTAPTASPAGSGKESGVKEGFEVFQGVELAEENPSKLQTLIGKFRKTADVLIVHGGSEKTNRAAVENPRVDILNHPAFEKSSGLNQVLAKTASENNVAIGLNLRPILHLRGSRRIHLLSDLRANLELARKYEVSLILLSDAASIFDLRAPMEILALGELCGLEENEVVEALSTVPEEILSRNRPGPGFIREGIEVLEEDCF
jgi:ribonuclease P/MRP protein subunit RPP1